MPLFGRQQRARLDIELLLAVRLFDSFFKLSKKRCSSVVDRVCARTPIELLFLDFFSSAAFSYALAWFFNGKTKNMDAIVPIQL
jgi:hypothetical protein